MQHLILTKLFEVVIDRARNVMSSPKTSAAGVVNAAAGTAIAQSVGGLDTLEGQVTAVVTALLSLALFLMKDKAKKGE